MSGTRSAATRTIALCLLALAASALSALAADTWPNCSFKCTAGDVSLVSIYAVVPGGACEPGGTSTAQIYGRFTASANRYAVILIGDLHVEGGATQHLEQCGGDLSAGTTDVLLTTVSWPCGRAITLGNVLVSWSANPETCASATCSSRAAKCSQGEDLVVSTPLVVDFTSTSPQCLGTPISFANASTGGTAPYTYSWTFGDGGTSSQANPSYTYNAPGTYAVTLTIRDRMGSSDSHTRSAVVSALPAATAGNAGPYCPGTTISLVASGGASYAWRGPGGFASSLQNPTISSANAAKAGTYNVTVTNSAGCSAQASTVVVVDSTAPTLTAPAGTTVECGHPTGPAATGQATAIDNSGSAVSISHTDVARLTGCGGTGAITRTWTATDGCGNSTSVIQTITIADATAPTLLVPADVIVECGHSTLPAATGQATATDLCAPPVVSYSDQASLTSCGGTIARTWTATDTCGNRVAATQTITVIDSLAPNLSVPSDITVECGHSTEPGATGQATATDACLSPTVTHSDHVNLTGCGGSGTIVRTWTAADACGHTSTGVQTITVVDSTTPQMTLPSDVAVECGHSTLPTATGQATATDNCSTPLVAYVDDAHLTGCGGTGTIYRTWTATDACGHVTAASQKISVIDTRAPSLTVPGDVAIEVGQSSLPTATGEATAADECSAATVTYSDSPHLASDGTGTIVRTWMATDPCGQSSVGEQTIVVVSAPPPPTLTLTIPADATAEAGHSIDPTATGSAIASSTCPTSPTLGYSDIANLTGCDGTGTILRTWTAADACGNTKTGVQTIVVVDTGGLLLSVPNDVTIEAETPADPSVTGWATASDPDAADELPTVTYTDTADLSGCDETGTILRTWTAADECGNTVSAVQTITVIDSGHAELTIPTDVTIGAGEPSDPAATGWATASDPDAVDEPPLVTHSDVTDLSGCDRTGAILRTWTATDGCGNRTSAVQTITVVDLGQIQLTVPPDVTVDVAESADPSTTGWATASDPDATDEVPTVTYSDAADRTGCDGTGTILRMWTATDECGNTVSAVQTITLVDEGHVSLLVPPPATVACGHSYSPGVTGWATASDPDAADEAPIVTHIDTLDLTGCGGAGIVTRTWTAADECGNAISAVQTITLVDTTPPTLGVPADIVVEFGDSTEPAATGRASATDACSTTSLSHSDVEVPGECVGSKTV